MNRNCSRNNIDTNDKIHQHCHNVIIIHIAQNKNLHIPTISNIQIGLTKYRQIHRIIKSCKLFEKHNYDINTSWL